MRAFGTGLRPMRLDTAVGFLLAGISLLLLSRPAGTWGRAVALAPILVLFGLTAVVGTRALLPPDPAVTRWLTAGLPGGATLADALWMSPTVIVSFLSLSVALVLIERRPMARVAWALLAIPLALAWLNILDLLLHDSLATLLGSTAQMAPATAMTLVLVAVGALALLGPDGPLAVFLGPSSSSRIARRLLFAALVVPALVAWVRLQGEVHGLYAAGTGTSLVVLGTFLLLAVVIWQTARVAGRTEAARKAALDELDRFFDVSVDMLATDRCGRPTAAPQPSLDQHAGIPGGGHGRAPGDRVRPSRRPGADRRQRDRAARAAGRPPRVPESIPPSGRVIPLAGVECRSLGGRPARLHHRA